MEETSSPVVATVKAEKPTPKNSNLRSLVTLFVLLGGLLLLCFLFVFGLTFLMGEGGDGLDYGSGRIGVVEVIGPIMESKTAVDQLRKFRRDKNIDGIVVRVDSPGGAVAPSQEIFEAVKAAKKEKPLAVSMGSTAASGGYYIAIGSDQIFANPGTVTGSIGVITQLFNVSKIAQKVELDVHTITTGKSKDMGNMFRPYNEDDDTAIRSLIGDIYEQFVEDVAKGRSMEVGRVKQLADGGVFTGRQALKNKLVDELGTFDDTVDWVAKKAKLEGVPKIVYPEKPMKGLSDLLKGGVQTVVGEVKNVSTPMFEYRFVGPR